MEGRGNHEGVFKGFDNRQGQSHLRATYADT
jgi:hypothetical protein